MQFKCKKFTYNKNVYDEKPFIHKKAYANVKSNFIFQEEAAELLIKIIKKKV